MGQQEGEDNNTTSRPRSDKSSGIFFLMVPIISSPNPRKCTTTTYRGQGHEQTWLSMKFDGQTFLATIFFAWSAFSRNEPITSRGCLVGWFKDKFHVSKTEHARSQEKKKKLFWLSAFKNPTQKFVHRIIVETHKQKTFQNNVFGCFRQKGSKNCVNKDTAQPFSISLSLSPPPPLSFSI